MITIHANIINPHCTVIYTKEQTTVVSYDVPVIVRSTKTRKFYRLWNGYSVTTLRDINKAFPFDHITKEKWVKMPVIKEENLPNVED